MFPLRDTKPTQKFPFVTTLLILINSIVFFLEVTISDTDRFISSYALIPSKVDFSDFSSLKPFITSQFLHAGFIHILSNMWFLKIFGDNVEEKLGSIFYLFVYLSAGAVGGFLQYLFLQDSTIPMLGASGAVAGILGAYMVFFPRHKIETLVFYGFFISTVEVSASVMLGYWFLTQLFSGFGSIVATQVGGIAWWAHVGGFATGFIFASLAKNSKKKN